MLYSRNSNLKLSTHFRSNEFDCKCGCKITKVDLKLIAMLEELRAAIQTRIIITSGFRCKEYQDSLTEKGYETSHGTSQHTLGRAADIMIDGLTGQDIADLAKQIGFTCIGIGPTYCHLDTRCDHERLWVYG